MLDSSSFNPRSLFISWQIKFAFRSPRTPEFRPYMTKLFFLALLFKSNFTDSLSSTFSFSRVETLFLRASTSKRILVSTACNPRFSSSLLFIISSCRLFRVISDSEIVQSISESYEDRKGLTFFTPVGQ